MADLSLSKQCDIKLKAEEVWADSQGQREMYEADAESIKTLYQKQAGRVQLLTQIENPNLEDDTVKVIWIDNCDDALDASCQDVCDFSGTDKPLASKDYTLTNCKSASFSIDENDLLRNNYTLEEYAAKQLMTKMKSLDEFFNIQSLLFLSANAGYNSNQTMNGTTVDIAAANYTVDLLVEMAVDARLNRFSNPFVLDSGTLFKEFMKVQLEKGNSDGSGPFNKKNIFDTSFDLFGFAASGITDTSFLVNPGAYAFAHRNYNTPQPMEYVAEGVHQIRYTIPSNNIPGLSYDVYYKKVCSGHRTKHVWYLEKKWGFLLNPAGCDIDVNGDGLTIENRTGILSYTKS